MVPRSGSCQTTGRKGLGGHHRISPSARSPSTDLQSPSPCQPLPPPSPRSSPAPPREEGSGEQPPGTERRHHPTLPFTGGDPTLSEPQPAHPSRGDRTHERGGCADPKQSHWEGLREAPARALVSPDQSS